jgi:transketolase
MTEPKSCREAMTDTLLELARKNKDIVAVTSDARGSCSLEKYSKALPGQFIECGIAEQDEIGIAAGLAAVGKHPYVFAPACFLSARSLEQIKVDVAYSHQNVKIFGVSGGISYGALGASHHSTHDIAVMRAFPDLAVILPCDAVQTEAMLRAVEERAGAVYIRAGRAKVPAVYDTANGVSCSPFVFGKANIIREGTDLTIIACGELVYAAMKAADKLKEKNIHARVLDMHTLKPLDTGAVIQAARETGAIITVEEHSINGGLGAAVSQAVCEVCPVPVHTMALPDEYIVAGGSADVFRQYGLTAGGIAEAAEKIIGRKRA